MRPGDDPSVINQRRPEPPVSISHLISVLCVAVPMSISALIWGSSVNSKIDSLSDLFTEYKKSDLVTRAEKVDGKIAALDARVVTIEELHIQDRLAQTDSVVKQLSTKMDDVVKRLDDSRTERLAWQLDTTALLRDMTTKVTTLMTQQQMYQQRGPKNDGR